MTTLIPEIHNPKSNPSPQVAVRAGRWLVPLITAAMLAGVLPLSAQGLPAANEAQLLTTLKSDAPRKDKSDACIVLARVATKEAVPVLAPLLADADFNHMARYALETIADPSADAALLEAAGKLNGLQLAGVISSLGVRRTPKADQVLPGFLMHPDAAVVEAAARALGNLATPVAIRSLQAALTKVPARQQTAVSEGLLRAAEALLAQGKPGEATVIFDQLRPLTTVPSHVRAGALRGAIIARGSAGVPLLAEGLRSDDFVLVDAAIRTALEVPGADVTAVLVAQMPQLSADHRILILQTLAQRQDPAALSALSTAARSGDLNVRIVAVRGLTQLGNPAAAPVLAELLTDPERAISQAAQDGLSTLPGAAADEVVVALLNDNDTARRLVALEILGRRRVPPAVPALWNRTTDSDARVRAAALRRVSEQADPAELLRLLNLLAQTTTPQDLSTVAQAVGTLAVRANDADGTATVLGGRLAALTPAQQAALLDAVGSVGGARALETVRAALRSEHEAVRAAALATLADWRTFDAAQDLLQVAKTATNPDTAATAFDGCARLCVEVEAPSGERFKVLQSLAPAAKRPVQERRLLSALGEVQTVASLQLVATYLSRPDLVNEAGAAAVKICSRLDASGKAEAAPVLNQVLKSAKAKPVLDGARKQMERLGIKAE